jgi:Signal peptidase (SPase) II
VDSHDTHWWSLDRSAAAGACALVLAVCADLGSKVFAISHGGLGLVVYNDIHAGDFRRRVLMSLVAVAVTFAFANVARRRGIGRLWGAWIGAGLLVGGVLANGVSQFIWSAGVPDFIHVYSLSPDVWNVADFEIAWGLTGGIVSIAATVLIVYVREHRGGPPRPLPDAAANVDG